MANSDLRCTYAQEAASRSAAVDGKKALPPPSPCPCGPAPPRAPVLARAPAACTQDINGICPPSVLPNRAQLAPTSICAAANPNAQTSSQRCHVSASLVHGQHAGGKGPAAHWRRSGVCRVLDRPHWTRLPCLCCLMQQLQCDNLEPRATILPPNRQRCPRPFLQKPTSAPHPQGLFFGLRYPCFSCVLLRACLLAMCEALVRHRG